MNQIKFSKEYVKLHGQTTAKLLAVYPQTINNTYKELIDYDTIATDGTRYELKPGKYILLVFIGDKHIPFTTIRSDKPAMNGMKSKWDYYKEKIGEDFAIVRTWESKE